MFVLKLCLHGLSCYFNLKQEDATRTAEGKYALSGTIGNKMPRPGRT
jgi:hypothetical protein